MEQTVLIKECLSDGTARVLHTRKSACSGECHSCSGCGAAQQQMLLKANNPIGAKPGDWVKVESATGPVLAAAAVLYMIPVVLFVAGYLLGEQLWGLGPVIGILSFVLGFVLAGIYDRLVAKKKTVYTITGFAEEPRIGDERID